MKINVLLNVHYVSDFFKVILFTYLKLFKINLKILNLLALKCSLFRTHDV